MLGLFGLMAGCGLKLDRDVNEHQARFRTTDASELYFRNVRSTAYEAQELPGNQMRVYRMDDRSRATDRPVLNLAIALNWQYDEAYVLVEPNGWFPESDTLQVAWEQPDSLHSGLYTFAFGSKENHFRFASQLQRSLLRGDALYHQATDGTRTPLLAQKAEREIFRKTMIDYYRLVELD
ncbi:hypothetical protein SAMN05421823_103336 [Catalinimonas alkaloidigena]|uniref:Uncharacterized protein n=2 Tax=Catalinimonas alkaloidigena TaxID=1075417 RepID=A0A1G9E3A1_9BACT|nr:hypothetical protein SAMN05421823_103336 [Catalinimonas alkaloidigena]